MMKDKVVDGFQNAPHRSLYHALGLTKEELSRPLIGIVSSYNEIVPGHMNLDKITEAVKLGVAMAGGTPIMFPAITVCDGIAMGHVGMKYSLVTRDLIADSTEAMVMAHGFDGLVMIPNCDKNVPGLLMAAARLNIPTIFVSGGPMLAGRVGGEKRSLSSMFEAVGAYTAGKIDEAKLCEFEEKVCPTCGSCSGMYTANSMNCLTEVMGMGLCGNGTIPAVYSARIELAKHAGMQVMELVKKNIRPRDIMTAAAIRNAITADMALGCSTNSMLHLPAIANECGIPFDLEEVNRISEQTPNLCHLAPAGDTFMEDLDLAGGVPAVMKELAKRDLLNLDVMTVTGRPMRDTVEAAENRNSEPVEFMHKYHPMKSLAPRDIVARAIDSEMKRTGAECVYLDIRHIPEDKLKLRFPHIFSKCLEAGINMAKDLIPVVPAAHFICGGNKTSVNGETSIPGLYAVGECACTGLHGANRLASNSLLEAMVVPMFLGRVISKDFDELSKSAPDSSVDLSWKCGNATDSDEQVVIAHNWEEIRSFMWDYVGIYRTNKRLERARNRIELLRKEIDKYYRDYLVTTDLIELRNIATVAELIITCSLLRHESRGAHCNADYPERNPAMDCIDTVIESPL